MKAPQADALARQLPALKLDLSNPAPAGLGGLWPGPVDEVRLEIGFGGGEHLLHRARTAPRTGFIGVEPFVNSMAKMLASLEADGLPTSVFTMMTPRRFSIGCPIPWSIGLIFSIQIPGPR
jgi:tRNA (guanine-N7-)-methyltransferase